MRGSVFFPFSRLETDMLYAFFLQSSRPEEIFYNQGILGVTVVVLTFALYKLFKIVLNDRDKAIQQRDELLDAYLTKVLPALNDNTKLLGEITDVLKDNVKVLSQNDGGHK